MIKKVILDTNVLLYDPDMIKELSDVEIIIPIVVLDELDVKKEKDTEIGRNARKIIRFLDELRGHGNLDKGVAIDNGCTVRIEINIDIDKIPDGLVGDKADNKILTVGLMEKERGSDVAIISKDINLRVKCDALKITARDHKRSDVNEIADVYTGWSDVTVSADTVDDFYANEYLPADYLPGSFFHNQFVLLKNGKKSGLGIYKDGRIKKISEYKKVFNIRPRNKEQQFAFNLLLDPNIRLITMTGSSGCGKTLLALAAGLQQTIYGREYSRMIISKPNQLMGGRDRDLGFLPGNISEKMEPWIAPFRDNLEFICGENQDYEEYMSSEKISVQALTYMRGRSIPNSFIIIDECQNLMPKEVKAIVTRVGYGSKIVLLGDISQIDNFFLDFATNGLTAIVESFKGNEIYGHVTLMRGERSELATLASRLL